MAGMSNTGLPPLAVRGQLNAIAQLRWRMFINGLRTTRGKLELVSRILVGLVFTVGGFGAFVGATVGSWFLVSQDKAEFLAIPLWFVFLWWQVFPVMSTAFTSNPDSAELLRFPLTYRSFFLVRLAYGYFDPASAIGSLVLLGILLGTTAARPTIFLPTLAVLLTFGAFNLLLMQMLFAWLERWLAQRRTREILGVLFVLFMLSFQLTGPLVERIQNKPHPDLGRAAKVAAQAQALLPPGLAAGVIVKSAHAEYLAALASLSVLAALALAVGSLLHLRLRAQFRGENLSEAAARPTGAQREQVRPGWDIPGFSQAAAAVFEKEMHYLARSGPMLLTLVMPLFVLVIFRLGPMNPMHQSSFFSRSADMAFPAAAAYSLLVLTNLVYNSFGGDGAGVQFFYASPVKFSEILLGKNLNHAGIVAANAAVSWIVVSFFYGMPHLAVTIATIVGLLFAVPLNFTAGNLLSIYSPKRRDFSTLGRQNVSQLTALAALGIQGVIFGVGVGAFALARYYGNLWIAAALFAVLSAISLPMYVMVLRRADDLAIERREALLAELCRA